MLAKPIQFRFTVAAMLRATPLAAICAGTFALCGWSLVAAQSRQDKAGANAEQLRRWVQQLDDDALLQRNDATESLIKAGRAAIPHVAEAVRHGSPEVVYRAMHILVEFALADDELLANEAKQAITDLAKTEKGPGGSRARQALRYVENYLVDTLQQIGAVVQLDNAGNMIGVSCDNTAFTDALLRRLGRCTGLTHLSLVATQVTDDGLKHLQKLQRLKILSLAQTSISDAALKHLEPLQQLEYLGLRGTKVTDEGLKTIAGFRQLKGLHLGDTAVTSRGIVALKPLQKLDFLRLRGTKVGDDVIEPLSELSALRRLDVSGTAVSEAGFAKLSAKLPAVSTRIITRDEDRE